MKRYGNLYDKICEWDNIMYAYDRAKKGKMWQNKVQKVDKHKEKYLKALQETLVTHTFHTSAYKTKTIYEPKERIIYVLPFYPDRIVQHAIMNVLEPLWESFFIKDSYACRQGKGQHKGSLRCMEFVRKNDYCLQCDVSKFYPSIDHDVLKGIIRHKIKDDELLWLLDDIIDSTNGVPIGNYTSQWFGNLYLTELDRLIKQTWHIKSYIRYCDDFLLFGTKERLKDLMPKIEDFLCSRLKLRLSRMKLYPVSHGVDFLGYRHFPNGKILVRKSTAKRIKARIKALPHLIRKRIITRETGKAMLESTKGWLMWANTHNLSYKLKLDEMERIVSGEIL